jgi:hypothetical protein
MRVIKIIPFWPETDALKLTPFSRSDYLEYRLPLIEDRRGVHVKEYVRDQNGQPWIYKSGALGERRKPCHTDAVENARRVAFPIHEALVSLLLHHCDVLVNPVYLGFRTMSVAITGERVRLLVSIHGMRAATSRHEMPEGFVPSERFVEDFLVLSCLNVVLGQRDLLTHNYMVTDDDQRLLPVDNGDCMMADWMVRDCEPKDFELTLPEGAARPVSAELLTRVKKRLASLSSEKVGAAFAALPRPCVEWHDKNVAPGSYVAGTIHEKQVRVKANLDVLGRWIGMNEDVS